MAPRLLILFIASFFTGFAHGQFSLDIKAGFSLSTLSKIEIPGGLPIEEKPNLKPGFLAGFSFNYRFSNKIGLKSELLYIQKGSIKKYYGNDEISPSVEEIKIFLNYIELPVFVEINALKNFYIAAGPSISYLLKGDFKPHGVYNVPYGREYNIDDFTRSDFLLNTNVAYRFNIFEIGARYSHGFMDVVYKEHRTTFTTIERELGKNRLLSFYAAFEINKPQLKKIFSR